LNLGGGTSGQTKLISDYGNRLKKYRHLPMAHPVVIVCDNDKGSTDVFRAAGAKAGKVIDFKATDQFYFLGHNLYLVKVPEGPTSAPEKDIEDLFSSSVLSTPVGEKLFDKKKEHGDTSSYGKVVFAEKVVRPNKGSIDFSGFDILLTRIAACIADYAAKSASKAVGATGATASTPAATA
jgi:RNA-directed DNA polymerase